MTRLLCVNDNVPAETVGLLEDACDARAIEYVEIDARTFTFDAEDRAEPTDLLYRPAVSLLAQRVEQHLYQRGVATFYSGVDEIYFGSLNAPLLHQRAGVPIPRTFNCTSADRSSLREYVERLGGLPVVVKILGFSSGIGVMRVDSLAGLYSLVDYLVSQGSSPQLSAYVDGATHWRAVVVGDRMVASYRNVEDLDDFRTYASADPDDYLVSPPADLEQIAVAAVRVLRRETGGVDVLEHPSGRLYVLEANFPCYFPQAQRVIGVDIAGAMVEHLLTKRGEGLPG